MISLNVRLVSAFTLFVIKLTMKTSITTKLNLTITECSLFLGKLGAEDFLSLLFGSLLCLLSENG